MATQREKAELLKLMMFTKSWLPSKLVFERTKLSTEKVSQAVF